MQRIHAVGICPANPGKGGWAWVSEDGTWACGEDPRTTLARMELIAAVEALNGTQGSVSLLVGKASQILSVFRSDAYLYWESVGWETNGRAIRNKELWESLVRAWRPRHLHIKFEETSEGSLDEWGVAAQALAKQACDLQTGARGTEPPFDIICASE